jgi:hypothetical protein
MKNQVGTGILISVTCVVKSESLLYQQQSCGVVRCPLRRRAPFIAVKPLARDSVGEANKAVRAV